MLDQEFEDLSMSESEDFDRETTRKIDEICDSYEQIQQLGDFQRIRHMVEESSLPNIAVTVDTSANPHA